MAILVDGELLPDVASFIEWLQQYSPWEPRPEALLAKITLNVEVQYRKESKVSLAIEAEIAY